MKYNSKVYAKEAHKPAKQPKLGDLVLFFGHIQVSVQADLSTRTDIDYVALAKRFGRGIMLPIVFKKKK